MENLFGGLFKSEKNGKKFELLPAIIEKNME